jgi:SAM-dependent methyltransferase
LSPEAYLEMADIETRHWWFLGRRAILAQLIGDLALPPNAKILEVGSGTGGNLQLLSSFGQVSAMEMDATARSISLQRTHSRVDIRAGICPGDIPFADERFDLICMFDVLEHIDEDVATLVRLKRLLSDGGRMLITVPAYRWMWSAHDEFLHHKRRYSRNELQKKIQASGFQAARISHFNTLLFPVAALVRIKDRLLHNASPSGGRIPVEPTNQLLTKIFCSERSLLNRMNLPFGVSLFGVLYAADP